MIDWLFLVVPIVGAGLLVPVAMGARSLGYDPPGGCRKLHDVPTSRLGGAVIVLVYMIVVALAPAFGRPQVQAALPLAWAALPVVLVGLAEDLTRGVRPRYRMVAAIASAACASVFAGGAIPRIDFPPLDDLMAYRWFVLPLTWFMVAGACNAFNLIDGSHGLAGGTALILFGGLAGVAALYGDTRTLDETLPILGALAGFLVWNYPRGRIFLGDAGAYFIGFMYAELAMRLIARNDDVSAWYVIMLAAYPIVETLYSMYRRVVRQTAQMAPDALHLHSLVFQHVALPIERRLKVRSLCRANARVAPRLWIHAGLCLAAALAFRDNAPALLACLTAYAALYLTHYRAVARVGLDEPVMASKARGSR